MVLFENVCKPTALISEWPSLSSLHRETVSGRDEALLPMRSQRGLETEHTGVRLVGFGDRTPPLSMWDCRTGLGVRGGGEYESQTSRPQHLESASRGRTRNQVFRQLTAARFAASAPRAVPSPGRSRPVWVPCCSLHLSFILSPGAAQAEPALPSCLAQCLLTKAGRVSERALVPFLSTGV